MKFFGPPRPERVLLRRNTLYGQVMLWIPEGRVGSWMKSIFLMPDSDPVRNYSLNFKRSEGRESCEEQADTSIQETGSTPCFKFFQQQGNLRKHSQHSSYTSVSLNRKNHSYEQWEMEGYSCPFSRRRRLGNSSLQNGYKNGASHDQDERQSDGSMHWDTIGPVLLKAFAKHGARNVSEKYWLYLIHEGSSKARIEYCEDSTKIHS